MEYYWVNFITYTSFYFVVVCIITFYGFQINTNYAERGTILV